MEAFKVLTSIGTPLPLENIDTDQVIPARFLKGTTRAGFGENLFRDWRYDAQGNPRKDFILNKVSSSHILITGKNFGCGSSREHAAWAIYDFGFRVVVSSFFADIFINNALNNGLLPVQVSEGFLQSMFQSIDINADETFSVNLKAQSIMIDSIGRKETFEISTYKKHCLLNGLDDIDYLISQKGKIKDFEKKSAIV